MPNESIEEYGDEKDPGKGIPRELLLFFDGTDNTLTGRCRDTNVLELYQHLSGQHNPDQLLYYDPGVGSPDNYPPSGLVDWLSRKWERLTGLAEGAGVFDNISQGYAFLMRNYREGDRIYLFGFSRGAFTARAVGGMIQLFGILDEGNEQLLQTLLRVYFSPAEEDGEEGGKLERPYKRFVHWAFTRTRDKDAEVGEQRKEIAGQIQDSFTSPSGKMAWVYFVGVWDTVESVGLPGPFSRRFTSSPTIWTKDGKPKRFNHVRQALALDEHRVTFRPRVYEDEDFDSRTCAGSEREYVNRSLKQRWFPGAHSDVGGGYPTMEAGLSQATLAWMIEEARDCGLTYGPKPAAPKAKLVELRRHDEIRITPWWAIVGMTVRNTCSASQVIDPEPKEAKPPTKVGPFVVAVLGLLFSAIASGRCLSQREDFSTWCTGLQGWVVNGLAAFADFWWLQVRLAIPGWPGGSITRTECWLAFAGLHQAAWALWFDLLLTASWAYLLALLAAPAFTRLAGRAVRGLPGNWNILGGMPMLAVFGAVAHDLLLLATMALAGLEVGGAAAWMLVWLAAYAWWIAWTGLIGCVILLLAGVTRRVSPWRACGPVRA